MEVSCNINGEYEYPTNWPRCISSLTCPMLTNPSHGAFMYGGDLIHEGTECRLVCNAGYLPDVLTTNTCLYDEDSDDYLWAHSEDMYRYVQCSCLCRLFFICKRCWIIFRCVIQVGIVIGGISTEFRYLDHTEIFSPSIPPCHQQELAPFPHEVVGAVSGFVEGHGIVCGGAIMQYLECTTVSSINQILHL